MRFSGALIDHQLIERAPDPADPPVSRVPHQDPRVPRPHFQAPSADFADDQFIAARPIVARASGAPLGWVIATRRVSPAMLTRLAASVSGSLHAQPIRQFDLAAAPADVRSWIGSRSSDGARRSAPECRATESGYAVLRDQSGRAAWVFRLAPVPGRAAPAAGTRDGGGHVADRQSRRGSSQAAGSAPGIRIGGGARRLGGLLAVVLALKQYFRHRRSVDSRYKAIIDQTNDGIVIVDSATPSDPILQSRVPGAHRLHERRGRGADAVGHLCGRRTRRPRACWRG